MDFSVGIGYDASISRAQEIAMQVLREHSAVLDNPEPMVLAQELAASTVILRIYFWVNSKIHSPLKVKSAVIRIIKYTFIEQGISMPDDAREVIFPQGIHVTTQPATELQNSESASTIGSATNVKTDLASDLKTSLSPDLLQQSPNDSISSTPAEANLTSETQVLKEQADSSMLGEEETNLLKRT